MRKGRGQILPSYFAMLQESMNNPEYIFYSSNGEFAAWKSQSSETRHILCVDPCPINEHELVTRCQGNMNSI